MPRIDELRLISKVARLYYEQDAQQKAIAVQLGISQSTVSRLLKRASREGIVRTTVNMPVGVYAELEDALQSRFELQEAIVADCDDESDEEIYRSIGRAAAFYLETIVKPEEVIGISSWSAALLGMVDSMHPLSKVHGTSVVQILGGVGNPSVEAHATHLTQKLASLVGGEAYFLSAAGVASTPEKREVFLEDPYVRKALAMFDKVTLALVGIGSLDPSPLLASSGNTFSDDELATLRQGGAVGDICLRFFDANGEPVRSPLNDRVIGMTLDKIKQVGRSVGIAGGIRKIPAILAALRGGLINVLITDRFTARQLLPA
jgi:DNA-binding transcriptional regulator LsrR (DeoR family)